MEQKAIFYINDRTNSLDYENSSVQMQVFKDSLENSVSLVNCLSLNDSLNINANVNTNGYNVQHSKNHQNSQNLNYIQHTNNFNINNKNLEYVKHNLDEKFADDSIEKIEETDELSTEEKTRFSNNRKDLKKSYVLRSSQTLFKYKQQNNLNNQSELSLNALNEFEETAKISYKYISKADRELAEKKIIQNIPSPIDLSKNILVSDSLSSMTERFYWFAAYDKLINSKNIKKILKYFCSNDDDINNSYKEIVKEQAIILKDFEIFFDLCSNSTKPYIRSKKDGFVFLKLYYISTKTINKIFNYINKTEFKLKEEDFLYVNNLGDNLNIISKFDSLRSASSPNFSTFSNNNPRKYPYSELFCLGSFLNTTIFTFTNLNNSNNSNIPSKIKKQNNSTISFNKGGKTPTPKLITPISPQKPKIKTIIKLIKYLTQIFPNYSAEFFMYHLYSRCGINSNTNIKSSLQIQLTEIKKQLNKKKLKNLEISTNTNNKSVSISKSKEGKSIINTTTTVNHTSINTVNTINNNLNIKSINISTTHKKNISNTNSFRSFNPNPINSTIRGYPSHNKTISNPYVITNNKISAFSANGSNLKFNYNSNTSNYNSENISSLTKDIINVGNTSSKIYVVSRDSNIRFKTEFDQEDQDNSEEDSNNLSNDNIKNGNITMNEECYNTPTKKKVLRYYS